MSDATFTALLSEYSAPPRSALRPLTNAVANAVAPPPVRKAPAYAAALPLWTLRACACGGCGAELVAGDLLELLPASGGAFHCALKVDRGLESAAAVPGFAVSPHERAHDDARKRERISCAACGANVGITIDLDDAPPAGLLVDARAGPRTLLKARDVVLHLFDDRVSTPEAWSNLDECRAARGDADAQRLVAGAAAAAAGACLDLPKPTATGAATPAATGAATPPTLAAGAAAPRSAETDAPRAATDAPRAVATTAWAQPAEDAYAPRSEAPKAGFFASLTACFAC
ncbi:hypothetical protein M885DRAFT_546378 [Pelagophyceae sp. CCMP2097]|nr:hypothetical protein M885DRAFT_546378 [Pelagophyceae sp. CCMP2097]